MDELLNSASTIPSSSVRSTLDVIGSNTNPSKAQIDSTKLAEDFDTFLLLLTTQLENQDPTEPLDTNEFTNQLVQFSSVEQAIQTNDLLEDLVGLEGSNSLSSAVNYVGRFVDAEGNAGQLVGGMGTFAYELDAAASGTQIIITDTGGRAVFRGEAPSEAGRHRVTWDSINSFTGEQEPDGTYNIYVNPVDREGNPLEGKFRTFTTGPVTGAEVIDGNVILNVAGTNVPISDVVSIRQPVQTLSPGTNVAGGGEEDSSIVDDLVDAATNVVDEVI